MEQALTLGTQDPLQQLYDELAEKFKEQLLEVAGRFASATYDDNIPEGTIEMIIPYPEELSKEGFVKVTSAKNYAIMISISEEEKQRWREGYSKDAYFRNILERLKENDAQTAVLRQRYRMEENGLLYFEDLMGNTRLCVPHNLVNEVISEDHDTLTEGAHTGYHKTYNRLSSRYFWPRMSRKIKEYVSTCDVCQKIKPQRHAPAGLLQPIPVPSQPFEVISMDFITELPKSRNGCDAILVVVDKLTKYALFIPTVGTISEKETAGLFFKHVIRKFGIPRQVISDRDTRWRGVFWKEVCRLMGMRRALTTSYHPQADGQTKVMNQHLEIGIRAYVGVDQDLPGWDEWVDGLGLAYNSTPHGSTSMAPAYLLRGYLPLTGSGLMHEAEVIERDVTLDDKIADVNASRMVAGFKAERRQARDSLLLAQLTQEKSYNAGRLLKEFEVGDLVVINQDSLRLRRDDKGRGHKLLAKYKGPFEISEKLSAVTYRLQMPASYGIHPILNIAHLEEYRPSTLKDVLDRPEIRSKRGGFDEFEEKEVEAIIAEGWSNMRKGRREKLYKVRFKGEGPKGDSCCYVEG
jgi:hypothetical protein